MTASRTAIIAPFLARWRPITLQVFDSGGDAFTATSTVRSSTGHRFNFSVPMTVLSSDGTPFSVS